MKDNSFKTYLVCPTLSDPFAMGQIHKCFVIVTQMSLWGTGSISWRTTTLKTRCKLTVINFPNQTSKLVADTRDETLGSQILRILRVWLFN